MKSVINRATIKLQNNIDKSGIAFYAHQPINPLNVIALSSYPKVALVKLNHLPVD